MVAAINLLGSLRVAEEEAKGEDEGNQAAIHLDHLCLNHQLLRASARGGEEATRREGRWRFGASVLGAQLLIRLYCSR